MMMKTKNIVRPQFKSSVEMIVDAVRITEASKEAYVLVVLEDSCAIEPTTPPSRIKFTNNKFAGREYTGAIQISHAFIAVEGSQHIPWLLNRIRVSSDTQFIMPPGVYIPWGFYEFKMYWPNEN